jgi:hypothetical protein
LQVQSILFLSPGITAVYSAKALRVGQNFRLPKGGWEFSHNLIFNQILGGQNSTGCQLSGKLNFTFQLSENLSCRHLTKEVI